MFAVKLNVGDEVGFGRNARFGLISTGFGRVTKINGHGHITLDTGKVFDKHGKERGTNYGVNLIDADALRVSIAQADEQRERRDRIRALQDKVASLAGLGGRFEVLPEDKAELLALVNAL